MKGHAGSAEVPMIHAAWWLVLTAVISVGPMVRTSDGWHDPSEHQVRFVTVDAGVRLEVLDWGGSGQPVVLLGCYLTAHVYDDFAPKLVDQFHVYAITRRGIGASDKPSTGYTVQRSADDVLEVLESLKLQKPILIGNSCGGWVVNMLGAHHSDRLGGAVYLEACCVLIGLRKAVSVGAALRPCQTVAGGAETQNMSSR